MKTAISLPDILFEKAETTAKKLGISRSRLFSLAIEEFIQNYNPGEVTKKLNQIYELEASSIDSSILQMQIETFEKDNW